MKSQPLALLSLLICIPIIGFVLTPRLAADEAADLKAQVARLEREVQTLKSENETLKKENQSLRRIVANSEQKTTVAPVQSQDSTTVQTPTTQQKAKTGYWITTSSGVRHNSSCRYYMNSKGRNCGANEGRACKICGG